MADAISRVLSEQLTTLYQKSEIPPKKAHRPVVSTSSVKTMVLPRLPMTMDEHLKQWVAYLEEPKEESPIMVSAMAKLRDLVYSRRERMQCVLRSSNPPVSSASKARIDVTDSDDVFPTKSEVQLVLVFLEDLMKESLPSQSSSPRLFCTHLRCLGVKSLDMQED